jgi:hypothetical protein
MSCAGMVNDMRGQVYQSALDGKETRRLARSGFSDYYGPRDGTGLSPTDFSWSGTLALETMGDV